MKRVLIVSILAGLLWLSLAHLALAQGPLGEGEPEPGGMPGYPTPDKPIPHHEPGRPSRAGSYTTQVVRENELGGQKAIEISGVDALAADEDPLVGNYSLVNWDKILWSGTYIDNQSFDTRSYYTTTTTIEEIANSHTPISYTWYHDIAATDLNGDGLAEQIAVWIEEDGDQSIWMKICELEGYQEATSAPAAVHHSNGDVDLLVRGYDDALWHRHYDDGGIGWGGWNNNAGGTLLSAPAVASRADGTFDVFVVGADNQIYWRYFDGNGWPQPWTLVDGGGIWPDLADWHSATPELLAPAVVARGNQLDLFRLGPDNTLRWNHYNGSSWGGWQNLGGMISTGLGAYSDGTDIHVYVRGVDETLWHRTYTGGSWGDWQRLEFGGTATGVSIASAPTVVSPGEIYLRGSDNALWQYDGSWSSLGEELASGVAATLINDVSEPYLVFLASDGVLHGWKGGTNWSIQRLNACSGAWKLDNGPAFIPTDPEEQYENIWVDVEPGYFLGNARPQLAVAYNDNGSKESVIKLYEFEGGFKPKLNTELKESNNEILSGDECNLGDPGENSCGKEERPPRITAADVDGDGQDEIAKVYVLDSDAWYRIRVYKYDDTGPSLAFYKQTKNFMGGDRLFLGTLQITSGDFDGDREDEIAVISDWERWSYTVNGYVLDGRLVVYEPEDDKYGEVRGEAKQCGNPPDVECSWRSGMALAAGNLDGDPLGSDEIVYTWPTNNQSQDPNTLERMIAVLGGVTIEDDHAIGFTTIMTRTVPGGPTQITHLDRLTVGDFDRDLQEEIVFYGLRNQGLDGDDVNETGIYLQVLEYNGSSINPKVASAKLYDWPGPRSTGLVAAPLTGESLRVGPPTYRVQNRVDSVLAALNMPPKHWDIIWDDQDQEYKTINFLTQNCETPGLCTHALYGQESGETSSTTITTKKDWAKSTGFESKFSMGILVEGSMDNTYGAGMEYIQNETTSTTYSATAEAFSDDQIIYYGRSYKIWEYPVLADNTGGEPVGAISFMFPVTGTETKLPDQKKGRWCDEGWYAPRHQSFNVWSYDPVGDVLPEDYSAGNKIVESENTGGQQITIDKTNASELERTISQSHSFSSDLGLGFESSGSVEAGFFGFFSVSQNFETRFLAYSKTGYNTENITTDQLTTSQDTNLFVRVGNQDPNEFMTKLILYESTAGPLILHWQTNVLNNGFWAWYNKADPAFILPWYGFPDPDNLPFPDPNNHGAPPCGPEEQLFSHDVVIDPPIVNVGDTVTISATVRNFSNVTPGSAVDVWFYQGFPEEDHSNKIGAASIPNLDRQAGPQTTSVDWVVAGAGQQKIYAVLDPENNIQEMHDENHAYINNNMAYGLMEIGAASYVDMGTAAEQPYHSISYDQGSPLVSLYIPPGNLDATARFDLKDATLSPVPVVGKPFAIVAYQGDANTGWGEPIQDFNLRPDDNDPPAVIGFAYDDEDIPAGAVENNLLLWQLEGWDITAGISTQAVQWTEYTCPGYPVQHFPDNNLLLFPLCEVGVYAVLDEAPAVTDLSPTYLPVVLKNSN